MSIPVAGPVTEPLRPAPAQDARPVGLGAREAAARLARYGPNELPERPGPPWWADLLRQVTHPLALLLWGAAFLALVAGTPQLSYAILAVIGINAAVAFLQERQAARAISALRGYLPQTARVRRDRHLVEVPAADLVPGDLMLLSEGDQVSADARLVSGWLVLDASALTGESVPVLRSGPARATDAAPQRLVDAPDVALSGSSCVSGEAMVEIFATGAHTELGRIAALSQRERPVESPLERQVRRAAWLIAGVAIALGLLFLPLGLLAGLSLTNAAVFAVGLLVANVPEGLLPTITLALAVGVRVLARQGALVKRLSAVETLGSTTVICTDKTGTLTQNRMTVERVWAWDRPSAGWPSAEQPGAEQPSTEQLAAITRVMANCVSATGLTDPMEAALVDWSAAHGGERAARQASFPFDSQRKRMSVVVGSGSSGRVLVKGAAENVLPLCTGILAPVGAQPLTPEVRGAVGAAVDALTARGLRVIAVADRAVTGCPPDAAAAETDLVFLGLVALHDPPRPEVATAVADCHRAGIVVHVVTGDHGRTAERIARAVGLQPERVLTGAQAQALSEPELDDLLRSGRELIFSRSTPEDKLRIAEALQDDHQVVAMTGDGVNDAPALHRADIGVAMGRSGTEVAREAATMILTDDNFATIVAAVREGRRAYDNLRKFVMYIFAHAVGEVVPFALFALTAGAVPLPLTVLQILAIDLGTETLPALALGREPAEPDVMDRPPRPQSEHLISARLLRRAWLVMGTASAVLALAVFFAVLTRAGWHYGAPTGAGHPLHHAYQQATTATFLTLVACQVGTAFAARTERVSLRQVGLFTNRLLLWAILGELGFAAAVAYLPLLQHLFGTASVPAWALLLLLPCPIIIWGLDETYRWYGRTHGGRAHG